MRNLFAYLNFSEHQGIPFIILGFLILIWSMRRISKRSKETEKRLRDTLSKKDWI